MISAGDMSNSENLKKLAEANPKAKDILLYKAEIQERKHEILTNEAEYLKVLNVVDQVLSEIEQQLKNQSEGWYVKRFSEPLPKLMKNFKNIYLTIQYNSNLALFSGNWLCCENFSVADVSLAILLERLWELGFENRFWAGGKRPLLENYFERVKQRESFKKTIPNFPVHLKMIIMSQPPAYIGAAGAVSISVVLAFVYILKKLIH